MSHREAWSSAPSRTVTLRGNRPCVLDEEPTVHLIESGSVALFCAVVENGVPTGHRRLLARIGSGQAVFSVPGAAANGANGLRFLIVPIEEAVIREADPGALWGRDPALRTSLAHLAEEWIGHLADVMGGPDPARPFQRAGAGPEILLEAGQALAPARSRAIWASVSRGAVRLPGRGGPVLDETSGAFPLCRGVWVRAEGAARVATRRTADVSDWADVERGLARLHALVLAHLGATAEADADDELVRLMERDLVQADRIEEANADLAGVFDRREPPLAGDSPLWKVASAVGRSIGVEIRPEGRDASAVAGGDPLEAIARAARIRTRRVTLSDRWWTRDCGSLIGFTADSERRPIAILRTPAVKYDLCDPIEGTRVRVDARTAERVAPEAVTLYRPLPERALGIRDLFLFPLQGRERDLFLALAAGVLATLLGMVVPQATAVLMDGAIPDADRRLIFDIGAGLLAVAFGRLVFQLAQGFVLLRIGLGSEADSQAALWDRLLRASPAFFRRFSSGDLQSRVAAVGEVGRELGGATLRSVFAGFLALLNLLLLTWYSPRLTLLALLVGTLVAVLTLTVGVIVRRSLRELMELQGHFFGTVVQLINGVGKIRVAGAAGRAYTHWLEQFGAQLKLLVGIFRLQEPVHVFNHVLPILSSACLFLLAFEMLQESRASGLSDGLTLGTFLAFNVAFSTFLAGVTSLSGTAVELLDTLAQARRIDPILREEPEVDVSKSDPGKLTGSVALRAVDFRYRADGPLTLEHVDLRAEPGEFVALVGPSGSGKSTVLRLLLGFETPLAGEVAYDGQDLANLDVLAVRRQLGVVLQGGRVDAGSIYENIAGGALITLDDAWAAAEDAGFADEVREMPMGMHTIVSVGGGNLSGGQRQRLLIARALAHRPRILLFDEATSALDNRTQATVSESLQRLNVTRVVIAHRLSTIRTADRIYVLESGRVVQSGPFDALLEESGGLFARLMLRQMA